MKYLQGLIVGLLIVVCFTQGMIYYYIKSNPINVCPDINIEGCKRITDFYAESSYKQWSETYHALVQCQGDNDWSLERYYENPW